MPDFFYTFTFAKTKSEFSRFDQFSG